MFNHFANNRGPVFAADGVSGAGAASAQSAQSSLGDSGGGGNSDMTALFNQGMSQQEALYAKSMQQKQQQDELQTEGDAAMKSLKAVSF